jgi:hypothetical protein
MSIDLTGTTTLPPIILNEKSSFDIEFEQTSDDGITPVDFPTATWRCNIFVQGEVSSKLLLTAANGFTVTGNKMKIKKNAIQNVLTNGNYALEIRGDFPDGTNIFPLVGILKVEKKITGQ